MPEHPCPPRSRRTALALGASLIAGGLATTQPLRTSAQPATPQPTPAEEDVQALFVQSFAASELSPDPGDETLWVLTLSSGTGHALYFSDRPNRIAGTIPTDRFIPALARETEGDPANAALVAQTADGTQVTHVIELLMLSYDETTGVATYTVQFLSDPAELQIEFQEPPLQTLSEAVTYGPSELFIDAGGLMQLVAYGAQNVYD